jgi:ParB-like chromosome segregation protein Spo0J
MSEKTCHLFLDAISPNRRCLCMEEELDQLCDSLRQVGQRDPIRVHFGGWMFFIEDGEKRWRACKKLGQQKIYVVISNL